MKRSRVSAAREATDNPFGFWNPQAPNFAYGLTARKFLALDQPPQLDLSCVRHMINAAEPVDAASIDRFYAVFESHGLKR